MASVQGIVEPRGHRDDHLVARLSRETQREVQAGHGPRREHYVAV